MGLMKAFAGALGGTFADQWKDFITVPDTMTDHVLAAPGVFVDQNKGRGSNTKHSNNIISDGSMILVPENTAALIVDAGHIYDVATEPGGYIYQSDNPQAKSIFAGDGITDSLIKQAWQRFKFGGQPGAALQVVYINMKEIAGMNYGTANPIRYKDGYYGNIMLAVTSFGNYSIKVKDPVTFDKNLVPVNVAVNNGIFNLDDSEVSETLFSGVIGSLSVALSAFTKNGKSIDDIQNGTTEFAQDLEKAVEENYKWLENYGLALVGVQPRGLDWNEESAELIQKYNLGVAMQGNVGNAYAQATVAEGILAGGENGGGAGVAGLGMGAMMMGNAGMMQQQPVGQQPLQETQEDPVEKLQKLKTMLEEGLITEEEYNQKKSEIIANM